MQNWSAVFDWDGVLLDSSRFHEEAWSRLASEEARPIPAGVFKKSFGMKNERVITELLGWTRQPELARRLGERKEEWFRTLVGQQALQPLAGVAEWLASLHRRQVPCAIASSTSRANIDFIIDRLGLRHYFQAIVAAEDVTCGKPDPQAFLLAARGLGARPARCVVFEDSQVGIEAALAAGMKVVAVASTHPPETLQQAHRVVRRLDELTLEEVDAWFARSPINP